MANRTQILAAGVLAQLPFAVLQLGLPSIAPILRSHFAISIGTVGLLLAAVTTGFTITVLAWGVLADAVGERPVVVTGLVITMTALAVLAATTPSLFWTGALLAIAGVGGASAPAASAKAVTAAFPAHQRGRALAIRHASLPLGGLIGAASFPWLVTHHGFGGTFVAVAGLTALCGIVNQLWLPTPTLTSGVHASPGRDSVARRFRQRYAEVLRGSTRSVRRLAIGCAALTATQFVILAFVALYLHDVRHWHVADAAAVLALMQLAAVFTRPLLGWLSDALNVRMGILQITALALSPLLLADAATAQWQPALTPAFLITSGIIAASWNGIAVAATAELALAGADGAALGVLTTALSLSAALTPPIFAHLVLALSWPTAWLIAAACPLTAAVVLTRRPRFRLD